ncbi:hypothetical protein DFH11DRAFT_105184 [Phellopilus nigrolimitatus]|nr:hypothetical protein DFH11DRAFT_105184 [Phellopilus nigrolimitatus]
MPAIRINAATLHCEMEHLSLGDTGLQHDVAHDEFSLRKRASARPVPPPSPSAASVAKPTKKKKSSNAFILFRSHAIANHMLPESVKHQNDVSRMVAELWRGQDDATRAHFFKMADQEKARREMEEVIGIPDEVMVKKKKTRTVQSAQRKSREARRTIEQMPTPPPTPETLSSASRGKGHASLTTSPTFFVDAHLPDMPKEPNEAPLRPSSLHFPHFGQSIDFLPSTPEPDGFSIAPEWSAAELTSSLSPNPTLHNDTEQLDHALSLSFGMSSAEREVEDFVSATSVHCPYSDFLCPCTASPTMAPVAMSLPSNDDPLESPFDMISWMSSISSSAHDLDLTLTGGIAFL